MAWSAAVLLSLTGCQPLEVAPPVVVAVEPTFAWSGADTQVRVLGEGFWPEVRLSTAREEKPDPELGTDYRVFLVGPDGAPDRIALDTTWVSTTELTAIVASGAVGGTYDVEVVTPRGDATVAEGLFTITQLKPDHLRLDTDDTVVPVTGGGALVTIALYAKPQEGETEAELVPIDLPVSLVSREPRVTIDWLGPPNVLLGGVAEVLVSSEVAQTVLLTAAAGGTDAFGINDDTLALVFGVGDEWTVDLRMDPAAGEPPFVAGTSIPFTAQLVDEVGSPVDGNVTVTLRTNCGNWIREVTLRDGAPTPFDAIPYTATSPVCAEEYVHTLYGSPAGESERFQVVAGPVDHFYVSASPVLRQAGDVVNVVVEPEDEFGNRTAWSGTPSLSSVEGGIADVSCDAVEELLLCTAQVTRASDAYVIDVIGDDGKMGSSNPIVVLPDDVVAGLTVTAPGPATAGMPKDVEVRAQDAWGNTIDLATLGADAVTLDDEIGDATCAFSTFLGDGAAEYSCTFTVARGAAVVEAVAGAVVGAAAPIVVQNGALEVVTVSAPPSVTAGAMFTATLVGTDAYGNPYLVQADPVVALTDDMGTFPLTLVTLGPDGVGSAVGSLTLAGATVLRASQSGAELGASGAIVVLAGPGASFTISPAVPWAFVNEPRLITLRALDAFGNPADWEGHATLLSTATASPDVVLPILDGRGAAEFTWTEIAIDEVLVAEAEGFSSSVPFVVADDCGPDGPAVSMVIDGFDEGIDCLDPVGGTATFTIDLSASIPGVEPITGYVVGELGDSGVADTAASVDVTVAGAGPHPIGALVLDAGRCGAEAFSTAWAGPDDGTPTGPVAIAPQAIELLVFDHVSFDVLGVQDCQRQPAAFATIGMRGTAGALSGLVATGEGLVLALDASGNGSFAVDTNGALEDGVSEIHAFVDSGAARGWIELPIVGDNVRPVVVSQSPSGETAAAVGEITLTFSEPLSPDSVLPDRFVVSGPSAVSVAGATLRALDTEVVLTLSPAASGAAGAWTVTALADLLDSGGNPLAGTWGSGLDPYEGVFGSVPPAIDPVSCPAVDPPGLSFRPDGDPGVGVEADALSISLDSASAPAWWVLEVRDAFGTLRLHERIPPLGAIDTIVWDGRGSDGMVVENGAFTISVVPDDGSGNRGAGCTLQAVIDNRTGTLP